MVNGNGKQRNGGGVERATDVDEEVDEVSEQVHSDLLPEGLRDESLDDFLREIHGTTATGEDRGMPTVARLRSLFKTKSAIIRYLHHQGHDVKSISKHLGLRYQHVRNVLTTELKRGPNESWHTKDDETARISPGLNKI